MNHILLIHQAFVSPRDPGGTRHYELARYCAAQGHRFTIVASTLSYLTGKPADGEALTESKSTVGGLHICRAYTYPALHRSFVWRVVSFLSFMISSVRVALQAGPVDLVMGTSPPIFQTLSAWFVAALRRRPFLLEVRDLWPAFAIDLGVLKNPVLIALSRGLETFVYARATHILVNSPAYRDYLVREKRVPEARVSLIPNGVDPDMFQPESRGERIRRELDLDGQFVVTYAGALGMANDLGTVLRAAARLKAEVGIRFLLVGDGKERSNLEAQARELGLPNVTFAGARPKSEMPEILAASDVCIAVLRNIPMFRMTYPNKVFDYMAAGRPTVLAIDGVIREVIEASGGGLFSPPGDDAAMAGAVLRLYDAEAEARCMGGAARAYVVEHFNRSHQAQTFADLIARVARRG